MIYIYIYNTNLIMMLFVIQKNKIIIYMRNPYGSGFPFGFPFREYQKKCGTSFVSFHNRQRGFAEFP